MYWENFRNEDSEYSWPASWANSGDVTVTLPNSIPIHFPIYLYSLFKCTSVWHILNPFNTLHFNLHPPFRCFHWPCVCSRSLLLFHSHSSPSPSSVHCPSSRRQPWPCRPFWQSTWTGMPGSASSSGRRPASKSLLLKTRQINRGSSRDICNFATSSVKFITLSGCESENSRDLWS